MAVEVTVGKVQKSSNSTSIMFNVNDSEAFIHILIEICVDRKSSVDAEIEAARQQLVSFADDFAQAARTKLT